jgi:hypothetical protein
MRTRPLVRRPRLLLPAAAAAGLAVSLLASAPALATGGPGGGTGPGGNMGSGGGGTGCAGQGCYANVWQYVHLSGTPGAYTTGGSPGGQGQVALPPPPCYMEPLFSGPEMYQLWKQGQGERVGPNGSNPEAGMPAAQIKAHQNDLNGYWYSQVDNLGVGGACSLPELAWVPNGARPPLPNVPPIDLADYAYDHFNLPSPQLILNPAARSYVSLPTYVWARYGGQPTTELATATLGGESATVTATGGKLAVSASGGGTAYENCSATGSAARPVGTAPPNSGPGTTPDCGVVFHTSSSADTIGAKLTWTIASNYGGFPNITTTGAKAVSVAEIQNLNN